MKFETGTVVTHKRNPSWSATVLEDLHPRRPVNGMVRLRTTNNADGSADGWVMDFPKDLLKKVNG